MLGVPIDDDLHTLLPEDLQVLVLLTIQGVHEGLTSFSLTMDVWHVDVPEFHRPQALRLVKKFVFDLMLRNPHLLKE